MRWTRGVRVLAGTAIAVSCASGLAAEQPLQNKETGGAEIRVYPYDTNRIFSVVSRVGMFTEILVPDHEKIVSWFPSADDKKGWPYLVAGDRRRIMVMPLQDGMENSAVLVTDKHSYLLDFRSEQSGAWDQRVTWRNGELDAHLMPAGFQHDDIDMANTLTGAEPDFANMNINYKVEGRAAFRPDLVADDGTFTWFRLPAHLQELPAIFVLDAHDRPALVNYELIHKNLIKTQRTANKWLLKLGEDEVRVVLRSDATGNDGSGTLPEWFR